MADWATISSLATAGGTLVLAIATFSSVRSANRTARAAERTLQDGLRPLLVSSRPQDPPEKVSFIDLHWMHVKGGRGEIHVTEEAIYLAIALRNVGRGMAILHGWAASTGPESAARPDHSELSAFRMLTRDLYIPPGDLGFWQGAIRDPADPLHADIRAVADDEKRLVIELLYGDSEGGQRTITRFALIPRRLELDGEKPELIWLPTVSKHWNLDRADPR